MFGRRVQYVCSGNLLKQADKNPAVLRRASMAHELLRSCGLLKQMNLLSAKGSNSADLRGFHSRDYIEQLEKCDADADTSETNHKTILHSNGNIVEEYGLGFDCPTWPDIKSYAYAIAGATMTACEALVRQPNVKTVLINWTGGWHHAQRDRAAGFCYINDIVLGILVLRKHFQRVLYIDLDVHHGDGVEQAFEVTRRVFTLSFHKYECGFYPGTGAVEDCGRFAKGYSANFPYKHGITGEIFRKYFKRVTSLIMERYKPDVCVLQCGADAVVGDPLGGTRLVPEDIADCVTHILNYELPTLVLGGGGYNLPNACRFWAQLTASIRGQELCEDVSDDDAYFLQYGPDFSLKISTPVAYIKDENTIEYLDNCLKVIEENLKTHNVHSL